MLKVLMLLMILIVGLSSINAADPDYGITHIGGDCDSIDELNSPSEFYEVNLYDDSDDNDIDYEDSDDNYYDDDEFGLGDSDDDEDMDSNLDEDDDDLDNDEDDSDWEDYEDNDEDDSDWEDYEDNDDSDYDEDDSDWEDDDEDDDDSDWEDDDDDLYWDEDDSDWEDDDFEYEEISDFDYLKNKIIHYLYKFGNETGDWFDSEDFNQTYLLYLEDNSSYTFDEEGESYETYLKIYNSIITSLEDENLTDEERNYFKFLIIYYLNNYGNVTNYTWNESDEFENFFDGKYYLCVTGMAMPFTDDKANDHPDSKKEIDYPISHIQNSAINPAYDADESDEIDNNETSEDMEKEEMSWFDYILNILKIIFINLLAMIN